MATKDPPMISDEGLSVLHDPERPVADIIIIHGLGGHPYKTFASKQKPLPQVPQQALSPPASPSPSGRRSPSPNSIARFWKRLSCSDISDDEEKICAGPPLPCVASQPLHWPRDALPHDCSEARILVYGYDSHVTKGYAGSNKSNIFAHAKDLLWALQRSKPPRRPVIFVAHSLGGLIVKEVLRRSESSDEFEIQDIVKSIIGIIFLGTPHRGSQDLASLGDIVRSVAGATLRIDSNAVLLRALGAASPELELSRESFFTQWRTFGFKVKTFQEAFPMTGINVGPMNQKVVPDYSSSLDDPREHAETISANHMDMCRFTKATDQDYRKISGELKLMLRGITDGGEVLTAQGREFLQTLHFPAMYIRQKNIRVALDNTCNWLFSTMEYRDWLDRRNIAEHHGLLWIKGKPGAGKSTLMKEALHRAEAKNLGTGTTTAGFFFNARGAEQLEKTPLGLFRSILHQVLQQDLRALSYFIPKYLQRQATERLVEWHEEDLQRFLFQIYASEDSKPAFIFIDALDECDEDEVSQAVHFLRELTTKAWSAGAQLNVCLSSRHYPHISIPKCPEVVVEHHNEQDILEYIRTEAQQIDTISTLQDKIFQKSSGVFLWAVLVVSMLKKSGYGKSLRWMEKKLDETPPELNTLFRKLFTQMNAEDAPKAVCLMQWILFAEERLKMSDLHCVLGFRSEYPYPSIKSWEDSDEFLPPSRHREMIINLSRGLVEPVISLSQSATSELVTSEPSASSTPAPNENAEDPTFQFIHESVRDFFLKGNGFKLLDPDFDGSITGKGHGSIAWTCVNYLQTREIKLAAEKKRFRDRGDENKSTKDHRKFPLLRYVACYLFTHIEAAEKEDTPQDVLLNRLLSNGHSLFTRLQILFVGKSLPNLKLPKPDFHPSHNEDNFAGNESALYYCSRRSFPACTARLIQMGEDVNEHTTTVYQYPLLAAVSPQYPTEATEATVKILLEKGANVALGNNWKQTALHIAASRSTKRTVQMLVDYGANTTVVDAEGETPFHRARLALQCDKIIWVLLNKGAQVDAKDSRGYTVLHMAVNESNLRAVKSLIEAGCTPEVRNNQGKCAMDLARRDSMKNLILSTCKKTPMPQRSMTKDSTMTKDSSMTMDSE